MHCMEEPNRQATVLALEPARDRVNDIEVIIVPDTQEVGVGMFWEGGMSCLRCT